VRLVSVAILVASKDGKYLAGLSAADFRLSDEGRRQTIKVDVDPLPICVVVAVQVSEDVREYLPFVQRVGNLLANAVPGANGNAALITYSDEISVVRGLMAAIFPLLSRRFRPMELLKQCPAGSSHVLLFIGQPVENGSSRKIEALQEVAERDGVQIYALRLPLMGKSFVSDSFALWGMGLSYKGGVEASVELTKAVPALRHAEQVNRSADPFSLLTVATGGLQLPFRKQKQLEDGIIAMGDALRSRYVLSFAPDPQGRGFHPITVSVDVAGAKVYARPGYLAQ
jgi:hypothetical protein